MKKNLEGIVEIQLVNAEFEKKSSNFKIYFEFFIGALTLKSPSISSQKPAIKEKLNINYNNESLLSFKILEKNTWRKDTLLEDQTLDLTELIQKHKQNAYITINQKGKLKGSLSLILTLYPFTLTPMHISSNITEETLISSQNDETVYVGTLNNTRKVLMIQNSFKNPSVLKLYSAKLKSLQDINCEGSCKILDIVEKITETSLYLLVVLASDEQPTLKEEILNRREKNKWTEEELTSMLKGFVRVLVEYEKNNLFFGDLTPSYLTAAPGLIRPGVYYKTNDLLSYSDYLGDDQEWKVPYFSPLVMDNYYQVNKKLQAKSFSWLKSDVFSLGLIFLHMSNLKSPVGLNDLEFRLQERISSEIESLSYSDSFKEVLRKMLKVEEIERPTFSSLHQYLNLPNNIRDS